eukprot:TRINITY_DN8237_c0_g1_i5.p1 TRINITY_DN8237_c0_g1~~TRINITY_DN8237_c0_g1_i5.p1  ORF type:complete len:110 (-),score=36.26 TRINITY_DN8237_c0_g1_i5:45-374(-)
METNDLDAFLQNPHLYHTLRRQLLKKLSENEITKLAEVLKSNSTLTTLDLYDTISLVFNGIGFNGIGNEGAKRLAEALQSNSTLTRLSLRGNERSKEIGRSIAIQFNFN